MKLSDKNYILGFDPGFGGAYALYDIDENKIEWVKDMPLTRSKVKIRNLILILELL